MSNIKFNDNNFSLTEKLKDYTRNPDWTGGYDLLVSSGYTIPVDANGKVSFNSLPSNLSYWYTLSACFEDIGDDVYKKIYHFVDQIRDVETCNFKALNSIAKELDLENINFNYNYPFDIEKLINVFSMSLNQILRNENVLSESSRTYLTNQIETSLSGRMQGYDTSSIYSSSNPSGIWTEEQIATINDTSGNYVYYTLDDYTSLIDNELSATIMRNLYFDDGNILSGLRQQSVSGTINVWKIPDDRAEIKTLKNQYDVDRFFHVNREIENIYKGITKREDYSYTQQLIIGKEEEYRSDETFYDNRFQKYVFNKEQNVRDYITFIEDINVVGAGYIYENDRYYLSGNILPFFGYTNGVENSVALINNTVKILRNICLRIFYQREILKKIWWKNSIIGTSQIIAALVGEYIAKYFSVSNYWGYYPENDLSGINVENLPTLDILSGNLLGNVNVVEYYDSTEYMNLSSTYDNPTDLSTSIYNDTFINSNVNNPFWTGIDSDTYKLLSEHTDAEVSAFYSQLGWYDLSFEEQQTILNTVYTAGAVSATANPSWNSFYSTVNLSDSFGTYGQYTITETGSSIIYGLNISADIAPVYELQENDNTSLWLTSPLLEGVYDTTDAFNLAWQSDPSILNWQNNIEIDTDTNPGEIIVTSNTYNNLDQVSTWISGKVEYQVYEWETNDKTEIWRTSPLLSIISEESFKSGWAIKQTIADWKSFDAVTGTLATEEPFSKFAWDSNPTLIQYAYDLGHTDVSSITLSEWLSSEFIRGWNDAPFDYNLVKFSYDQETQWLPLSAGNPFVSMWQNEPFSNNVTNISSIESYYQGTLPELAQILELSGVIDPINGGLYRENMYTASSLSGMNFKYLGAPSGWWIPENHKNITHPTNALQPYLWNLSKKILDEVLFENVYSPILLTTDNVSALISSDGRPINSWRYDALDASAYQTYYEKSLNFNRDEEIDYNVDIDGPWNPRALEIYISQGPSGIINNFDEWYYNVNLDEDEKNIIKSQLEEYESAILALKYKRIYQYAVDKYNNQYMLYKSDEEWDTSGSIWMRLHNHPLAFPLSANIDSSLTHNFNSAISNCQDFDIISLNSSDIIWTYTEDDPSYVYTAIVEKNSNQKLITNKIPIYLKTKWTFPNEKFIGIYSNRKEFVITTTPLVIPEITNSDLQSINYLANTESYNMFIRNAIDNHFYGVGGNSPKGYLGIGDSTQNYSTLQKINGSTDFIKIVGGGFSACALDTEGTIWSWGYNNFGQFGTPLISESNVPISISGGFTDISEGYGHFLAISGDNTAWSWGRNNIGQLGNNDYSTNESSMVSVSGNHSFIKLAGGNQHSVGIDISGNAWGWGYNNFGQLGNGESGINYSSPVSVSGNHSFINISAGANFTLGLKEDGSVWSWGYNTFGELGNGASGINESSPIEILGNHSFIKISTGGSHSLGLKENGSVWSWGYNANGQLGNNSTTNKDSAVQVSGNHSFIDISTGDSSSYGLKEDGSVWAWGLNTTDGQLGLGDTINRSVPTSMLISQEYFTNNGVYNGKIKFQKYGIGGYFDKETISFDTNYNIYNAADGHNQWKLTKGDTNISIGFESLGPQNLSSPPLGDWFYVSDYTSEQGYDYYTNCNNKLFDNTITILDGTISDYELIPESLNSSYYWKYTDLTYQGLNSTDGLSGSTIPIYELDNDSVLRLQYFGNDGENGSLFHINSESTIYSFNDGGNLKIRMYDPAYSLWNDLSGSLGTYATEIEFTTPGQIETYQFYDEAFTNVYRYTFQYIGEGCHLFTISRESQNILKYVNEQPELSAKVWELSRVDYHGLEWNW